MRALGNEQPKPAHRGKEKGTERTNRVAVVTETHRPEDAQRGRRIAGV